MAAMGTRESCTLPSRAFCATILNLAYFGFFVGIVIAEMRAAAFFSFERRAGDDFGDGQQSL